MVRKWPLARQRTEAQDGHMHARLGWVGTAKEECLMTLVKDGKENFIKEGPPQ